MRRTLSGDHSSLRAITATPGSSPSPTVNAPPRVSTIGSHNTSAPAPLPTSAAPPRHEERRASYVGVSFKTDLMCIGETPVRYKNFAFATAEMLSASSASVREYTGTSRTVAPSLANHSRAAATDFCGFSYAQPVASNVTSVAPTAARSSESKVHPSENSPPPTSASGPVIDVPPGRRRHDEHSPTQSVGEEQRLSTK